MKEIAEISDILGRKRGIRKNVMVIRINRDNTPATNRLIMYFAIAIPPLS